MSWIKVFCAVWLTSQMVCAADLELGGLFADHMVMQCEKPLPVWGRATPGAAVTVEFAGQKKTTTSDAEGQWQITLDPLAISSVPRELSVSFAFKSEISSRKLTDVLVGEVWVCSGQSNMEVAMPACSNAAQEIAAADYPEIRLMSIPKRVDIHLRENPSDGITWDRCSPQSVAKFSAVGYFFGRHLNRELKVPVGLVEAVWGGTKIQAWTPLAVQEEQPWIGPLLAPWQQLEQAHSDLREKFDTYGLAYVRDFLREQKDSWQWQLRREAARKAGKKFSEPAPKAISAPYPGHRDTPGGLYGGMIHALTRMPVRGEIWYQGESDAGVPDLYERQFSLLIQEWRKAWSSPDMPFYFVQLASWKPLQRAPVEENGWSGIREAQRLVSERIPHTGMAVAIDIGDANTVHPLNKQDVGKRLALLALNRTYGRSCIDSGPAYAGMTKDGGKLRLNFRSADGLMSGKPQIEGFAVRGEKTAWQWAQARIEGSSVVVWNDQVPEPVAVRYAWASNPKGSLRNGAGLPAAPFQDDAAIPESFETEPFTPLHDLEAGKEAITVDTKLPNVLLIGDSISVAYTPFVRELLAGKANVFRPYDHAKDRPINCGSTEVGLKELDGWLKERKWDVIHFNWGLHDLCYRNPKETRVQGGRDKIGGKIAVPLGLYKTNLEQLVNRLEQTDAKLVWAATTRIPPEEAGRIEGDDVRYNAAAAAIMKRHGIRIDDLYTLTQTLPEEDALGVGNVHYKEPGSRKMAAQVAGEIAQVLGQ